MRVTARQPVWVGRPVDHQLEVVAAATGSALNPRIAHASFRQRALLPGWLAVVVPAVVALGFVLFNGSPPQVVVPKVLDQEPATLAALDRLGLKLEPCRPKASSAKPGTITQSPSPGAKVPRGTAIHCAVAVPFATAVLPDVRGKSRGEAERMLARVDAVLGEMTPNPPDADAVVTSMVPSPGQRVERGTAVRLYFSPIPPPAPDRWAMLADLGRALAAWDAATGTALPKLPPTERSLTNSASTPDGRVVVALLGTQLVRIRADGTVVAIRRASEIYDYPSFPRPLRDAVRRTVLAVVQTSDTPVAGCDAAKACPKSDSDLCLGKVTGRTFRPRCIVDPRFGVYRPHWSPDGKSIVVGVQSALGYSVALYQSDVAFSTNPRRWKLVPVRLPSFATFTKEIAVSPDGTRIAAVVHTRRGYRLVVTGAANVTLDGARRLPIEACKVEWIDESWLAVVTLGATCNDDTGPIVRMAPGASLTVTPVAIGDNPTFLRLGG